MRYCLYTKIFCVIFLSNTHSFCWYVHKELVIIFGQKTTIISRFIAFVRKVLRLNQECQRIFCMVLDWAKNYILVMLYNHVFILLTNFKIVVLLVDKVLTPYLHSSEDIIKLVARSLKHYICKTFTSNYNAVVILILMNHFRRFTSLTSSVGSLCTKTRLCYYPHFAKIPSTLLLSPRGIKPLIPGNFRWKLPIKICAP